MKILNENQTRRKATCDAPHNSGTRLHSGAPHKTAARVLAALLLTVLLAGLVAGCSVGRKDDGKIRIVTTIFPEYDWVREIAGDTLGDIDLTLLLDSGVDLHSYQPTVDDIVTISNCDLFVYVGGESDKWVRDALAQSRKLRSILVKGVLIVRGNALDAIVARACHNHTALCRKGLRLVG
jgi:zinc transport system substrate-binding protein